MPSIVASCSSFTQLGQAGCSLAFLAIALTAAPSLLAIYAVMFVSTALGSIDGSGPRRSRPATGPRRAPPGSHRAQPARVQRRLGHRTRARRHRARDIRRRRRLCDRRRDVRVGHRCPAPDLADPARGDAVRPELRRRGRGAALRSAAPGGAGDVHRRHQRDGVRVADLASTDARLDTSSRARRRRTEGPCRRGARRARSVDGTLPAGQRQRGLRRVGSVSTVWTRDDSYPLDDHDPAH